MPFPGTMNQSLTLRYMARPNLKTTYNIGGW